MEDAFPQGVGVNPLLKYHIMSNPTGLDIVLSFAYETCNVPVACSVAPLSKSI